jgi:hypothetical protein
VLSDFKAVAGICNLSAPQDGGAGLLDTVTLALLVNKIPLLHGSLEGSLAAWRDLDTSPYSE